jgi:dienelactone hydrolase
VRWELTGYAISMSKLMTQRAVFFMLFRCLGVLVCALSVAGSAHGAPPVPVAIPAASLSTSPGPLTGLIFNPKGRGPHPAVVMLHGCGGAYGRSGVLNPRHQMWGEYLSGHGYLVLMLDSFTSRGIRELCTQRYSDRTLTEADRVSDARAALAFLLRRANVIENRVGLLGWSLGGGGVLATISATRADNQGYAAAVAFYPGCTVKSKSPEQFRPYAPLLVLIGEADDWTPAAPCKRLAAAVAARGEPMRIVTYDHAYHGFDSPGRADRRVRTDVPNGVQPGRGVTVASHPEAREDAKNRVLQFFAEHLN